MEEIEITLHGYEEKLRQLEDAQFRASAIGDFVLYQRLKREKERIEEQIGRLYQEL